MRVGACSKRD